MSNVTDFNRNAAGWGRDSQLKMKNQVLRLAVHADGPGYTNLKTGIQLYLGEASKIWFSFPYYMIFFHKGAGRGYGGSKSGLFTRGDGSKGVTSPGSKGKMGTGKRHPSPWFNPVIEQMFPELAEMVNDYHGEKTFINIQRVLID